MEYKEKIYLKISVGDIKSDIECQCDIFIFFPLNNKMIRIISQGQYFDLARINSYKSKNATTFYILDPARNQSSYKFNEDIYNPNLPESYKKSETAINAYSLPVEDNEQGPDDPGARTTNVASEDSNATTSQIMDNIENPLASQRHDQEEKDRASKVRSEDPTDEERKVSGGESNDIENVRFQQISENEDNVKFSKNQDEIDQSESKVKGTADENFQSRIHGQIQATKDEERRFGAAKNTNEDMIRVHGSQEEQGQFEKKFSGQGSAGDEIRLTKNSKEPEEEINFTISPLSQGLADDENKLIGRPRKKQSSEPPDIAAKNSGIDQEILQKFGSLANEDFEIPNEVSDTSIQKIIKEDKHLQEKVNSDIGKLLSKMNMHNMSTFSFREKIIIEKYALFESELLNRLNLGKELLEQLSIRRGSFTHSDHGTYVDMTRYIFEKSSLAKTLITLLNKYREEMCATTQEEQFKLLKEKCEKIQDQLMQIESMDESPLEKIEGLQTPKTPDWLEKVSETEARESQVRRIVEGLTSTIQEIQALKKELEIGQNKYLEKIVNYETLQKANLIAQNLDIPVENIFLMGNAIALALSLGHREKEYLIRLAHVVLLNYNDNLLSRQQIPAELRNALLELRQTRSAGATAANELCQILTLTDAIAKLPNLTSRRFTLSSDDILNLSDNLHTENKIDNLERIEILLQSFKKETSQKTIFESGTIAIAAGKEALANWM